MRNGALALGAAIAIATSGCGSDGEGSGSRNVAVTLTDSGCTPERIEVPAGPTTFKVTNGGTSKVSEMELKDEAGTILGESENVVEGVPGQFSLNLEPGNYVVSCPNGDTDDQGTLLATGKASGQAASSHSRSTRSPSPSPRLRQRSAARRGRRSPDLNARASRPTPKVRRDAASRLRCLAAG